jgi:hypothetical protein
MDCSCGKSMGFGLRSSGFCGIRFWTYWALIGNGTGKPSTLMRRCGNFYYYSWGITYPASYREGGACVRLDASRGVPVNLAPRTARFDPNPRIFGNCLDGCPRGGHPTVCLGLPCKVKSIDCQPLTVIRDCLINWPWYPVMMELGEYCCMD